MTLRRDSSEPTATLNGSSQPGEAPRVSCGGSVIGCSRGRKPPASSSDLVYSGGAGACILHFVHLTVAGDGFAEWRHLGFDQWFRLGVPASGAARFDNLADAFDFTGYLK